MADNLMMHRLAALTLTLLLGLTGCADDTPVATTEDPPTTTSTQPPTTVTSSTTQTTFVTTEPTTTAAPATTTTRAAPATTTTRAAPATTTTTPTATTITPTTTTTTTRAPTTTTAPPTTTTSVDLVAWGSDVATAAGCRNCHSTNGSVGLGPSWQGLIGSTVSLADGSTVTATAGYIEESIRRPDARIVAGFPSGLMQSDYAGTLTDDEISALVSYIASR